MKTDNPYLTYYLKQYGGDFSPIVFHGYKYQRGRGFGSFFSSLFRRISPFLKTVGADIGKQLLNTGSHLIDDAVAGRNMKQAARERFSSAGKDVLNNSFNTLRSQAGFGRRKRKKSVVLSTKVKRPRVTKVYKRNKKRASSRLATNKRLAKHLLFG